MTVCFDAFFRYHRGTLSGRIVYLSGRIADSRFAAIARGIFFPPESISGLINIDELVGCRVIVTTRLFRLFAFLIAIFVARERLQGVRKADDTGLTNGFGIVEELLKLRYGSKCYTSRLRSDTSLYGRKTPRGALCLDQRVHGLR